MPHSAPERAVVELEMEEEEAQASKEPGLVKTLLEGAHLEDDQQVIVWHCQGIILTSGP